MEEKITKLIIRPSYKKAVFVNSLLGGFIFMFLFLSILVFDGQLDVITPFALSVFCMIIIGISFGLYMITTKVIIENDYLVVKQLVSVQSILISDISVIEEHVRRKGSVVIVFISENKRTKVFFGYKLFDEKDIARLINILQSISPSIKDKFSV
ncbi:hypothetical protein JW962_01905 [Candidatus Dojkabacteria bacterium]|nr:hypothetical protein [Candidatus Dojkabacteria bacterium]